MNADSQWSKQEACFACATQVWLAVNHKTCVISMCSAGASELGICQSNLCHSLSYERLQKFKDSLKACFENVNIMFYIHLMNSY